MDWRRQQRTKAQVRITIEDILDHLLPEAFTDKFFDVKHDVVCQHVYENYFGEGRSVYAGLPLEA